MSASSWFYYKDICYDARSHERKIPHYMVWTYWRRPRILQLREQKPSSAARRQYIYLVAYIYITLFNGSTAPRVPGSPVVQAVRLHSRHTTLGMTPMDE